MGDNIGYKICKGIYKINKSLFPNISHIAQDMIKQLLTVDYKVRFGLDQILKHLWFEKDILMKQKVNDFITEFTNDSIQSSLPYNKENNVKKFRYCSSTHATTSEL